MPKFAQDEDAPPSSADLLGGAAALQDKFQPAFDPDQFLNDIAPAAAQAPVAAQDPGTFDPDSFLNDLGISKATDLGHHVEKGVGTVVGQTLQAPGTIMEGLNPLIRTFVSGGDDFVDDGLNPGSKVQAAGKSLKEKAAAIPTNPTFDSNTSTKAADLVGNILPYINPAAVPVAGLSGYQQAFDDAKAKGMDDDAANRAGLINSATQMGVQRFVGYILPILKGTQGETALQSYLAAPTLTKAATALATEAGKSVIRGGVEGVGQSVGHQVALGDNPLSQQSLGEDEESAAGNAIAAGTLHSTLGALGHVDASRQVGQMLSKENTDRSTEDVEPISRTDYVNALRTQSVPEKAVTLQTQQEELVDGLRDAMLFPTGSAELPVPEGLSRLKTKDGVFHYDPEVFEPEEIKLAVDQGNIGDILDYGISGKPDLTQPHTAVVRRDAQGNEIEAVVTDQAHLPQVLAKQGERAEPGQSVATESPDAVLQGRDDDDGTLTPEEFTRQQETNARRLRLKYRAELNAPMTDQRSQQIAQEAQQAQQQQKLANAQAAFERAAQLRQQREADAQAKQSLLQEAPDDLVADMAHKGDSDALNELASRNDGHEMEVQLALKQAENRAAERGEAALRQKQYEDESQEFAGENPAQGPELLDAIKAQGGLPFTEGGGMTGDLNTIREGAPKGLFRRTQTKSLDQIREGLAEKGFDFETPDDVVQAVSKRLLTGKPMHGTIRTDTARDSVARSAVDSESKVRQLKKDEGLPHSAPATGEPEFPKSGDSGPTQDASAGDASTPPGALAPTGKGRVLANHEVPADIIVAVQKELTRLGVDVKVIFRTDIDSVGQADESKPGVIEINPEALDRTGYKGKEREDYLRRVVEEEVDHALDNDAAWYHFWNNERSPGENVKDAWQRFRHQSTEYFREIYRGMSPEEKAKTILRYEGKHSVGDLDPSYATSLDDRAMRERLVAQEYIRMLMQKASSGETTEDMWLRKNQWPLFRHLTALYQTIKARLVGTGEKANHYLQDHLNIIRGLLNAAREHGYKMGPDGTSREEVPPTPNEVVARSARPPGNETAESTSRMQDRIAEIDATLEKKMGELQRLRDRGAFKADIATVRRYIDDLKQERADLIAERDDVDPASTDDDFSGDEPPKGPRGPSGTAPIHPPTPDDVGTIHPWRPTKLWLGAADIFKRTPGLGFLGQAMVRHVDLARKYQGEMTASFRAWAEKYNRAERKLAGKEFDDYWSAKDAAQPDAESLYRKASEPGRELIDEWKATGQKMGQRNLINMVNVHDPRLNEGKGGYRAIGMIKDYFPRMLKQEVVDAMAAPNKFPKKFTEIMKDLKASGFAKTDEEAIKLFNTVYHGETWNDHFGNIEKARLLKLPASLYDHSFKSARKYVLQWAERTAQIEALGQKIGVHGKDLFDHSKDLVREQQFQGKVSKAKADATIHYIEQAQERAYGKTNKGPIADAARVSNSVATATELTNPLTILTNVQNGLGYNAIYFGPRAFLKGMVEMHLMGKFFSNVRDSREKGIVLDDMMNMVHDAETAGAGRITQKMASGALKYSGYNASETWVRSTTGVIAKAYLRQALKAWEKNPNSRASLQYKAFLQRNGHNAHELMMENGTGKATDAYLRGAVNDIQGGYRYDQVPIWMETPLGRFLFKYQKWGSQMARNAYLNVFEPAIKGTDVRHMVEGKMVTTRVREFAPLIRFAITAGVIDWTMEQVREWLFGRPDPTAGITEINNTLDHNFTRGLELIADKYITYAINSGALGSFGNYAQIMRDFTTRQRFKSPLNPPGLSVFAPSGELAMRLLEQGQLTAADMDNWLKSTLSMYRTIEQGGSRLLGALDPYFQSTSTELRRQDLAWLSNITRRYASEVGLDNGNRLQFQRIGKTPDSPYKDAIRQALLVGDRQEAVSEMRAYLASKPASVRAEALEALQASVRASQPLKVGSSTSEATQQLFLKWAQQRLSPEDVTRIRDIDNDYQKTAISLGLMHPTPSVSQYSQRDQQILQMIQSH